MIFHMSKCIKKNVLDSFLGPFNSTTNPVFYRIPKVLVCLSRLDSADTKTLAATEQWLYRQDVNV